MRFLFRVTVALLSLSASACSSSSNPSNPPADGGGDARPTDGSPTDGSPSDGAHPDASPGDSAVRDTATDAVDAPADSASATCSASGGQCLLTESEQFGGACPDGYTDLNLACPSPSQPSPNMSCCERAADAGPPGSICASAGGSCQTSTCAGTGRALGLVNDCPATDWCCRPSDGGAGDGGGLTALCTSTGGAVGMQLCCSASSAFPNTCAIGACSCSPTSSVQQTVCNCPNGECFDPTTGCSSGPDL